MAFSQSTGPTTTTTTTTTSPPTLTSSSQLSLPSADLPPPQQQQQQQQPQQQQLQQPPPQHPSALVDSPALRTPLPTGDAALAGFTIPDLTLSNPQNTYNDKQPQSALPTSPPKLNRTSLFALARDKTSSAIAILSEPALRPRGSSGGLYRSGQSNSPPPPHSRNSVLLIDAPANPSAFSSATVSSAASFSQFSHSRSETATTRRLLLETNPPSQAYSNTPTDTPAPVIIAPSANSSKMHQTSSRLLRMTSDDRPFTRDFNDLFATLVVSLPLAPHRVRLTRIEHSFLSEEAINNLGSLKFSQSNRMPDPKDPSRIVTTTTTTTFSMAREMARSVCQRFVDARFIESADGKQQREFTMKGTVWHLTPKGIYVLERFCAKNGIQQRHVAELVNSPRNTMQLVILERDSTTDKLSSDRGTIEVIFRRFVGQNGPNVKVSTSSADSDSLSEYKDGIAGVRMASERKVGTPPRTVYQTFTGKAATDWLMDCCTTVDRRETTEIASLFLEHELIWCVQSDRSYLPQSAPGAPEDKERSMKFQPSKLAIYQLSQKGKDVINMTSRERISESDGASTSPSRGPVCRDSNTQKLERILSDPALRLLFRENLRDTHCEENLSFYLDVEEFLKSCKAALKSTSPSRNASPGGYNLEAVKETMASAYGIYNAFLAPGSPCELNIDHTLRNQLATRMTKAVGKDAAMIESLREVTKLFEEAKTSVFKLMASDSVPKFMKSPKIEQTFKSIEFDSYHASHASHASRPSTNSARERSMSRSNTSNR